MPPNGYNTCIWIFFIPFVLIQIPSNLIMGLPRVKPNIFLGCNMIILGVVSTCQGLTHTYGGLLALRFLMGIFEATLPAGWCDLVVTCALLTAIGAAFLISEYYTRKEASLRFGEWVSSSRLFSTDVYSVLLLLRNPWALHQWSMFLLSVYMRQCTDHPLSSSRMVYAIWTACRAKRAGDGQFLYEVLFNRILTNPGSSSWKVSSPS